ncbi:MAG: hypothetical protein H6619_04300 [Deltaproteobacteria bacterium]|nr:hypothetical protein [Deltaproteobacteria bacterium]
MKFLSSSSKFSIFLLGFLFIVNITNSFSEDLKLDKRKIILKSKTPILVKYDADSEEDCEAMIPQIPFNAPQRTPQVCIDKKNEIQATMNEDGLKWNCSVSLDIASGESIGGVEIYDEEFNYSHFQCYVLLSQCVVSCWKYPEEEGLDELSELFN